MVVDSLNLIDRWTIFSIKMILHTVHVSHEINENYIHCERMEDVQNIQIFRLQMIARVPI